MLFALAIQSPPNISLVTQFAEARHFPYVVSVQYRYVPLYAYAVGIIVQAYYVLTSCSVLSEPIYKFDEEERHPYSDVRILWNGPSINLDLKAQVRFVNYVKFHPKCDNVGNERRPIWIYDVAAIRLGFPFILTNKGPEEIILSESVEKQMIEKHRRERELNYLVSTSVVCQIIGWGKYIESEEHSGVFPSKHMLASPVQLIPLQDCVKFCAEDVKFCTFNVTTGNKQELCAVKYRNAQVENNRKFPCTGMEGAPLICLSPEKRVLDLYGMLSYMPANICFDQMLTYPIIFTKIDVISAFVGELHTNSLRLSWNYLILLSSIASTLQNDSYQ